MSSGSHSHHPADPVVVEEDPIPLQLKVPEVVLRTESNKVSSEELERVAIGQDEEKYFQVRSQLPSLEKAALVKFLEGNIDVFAWSTYDALGTDPGFICH